MILAADPNRHAQGYFVYDSKKSGSYTISHLRFGPRPVRAPYLLKSANFVGVHKFDFLYKLDTLAAAAPGATVLINSPYPPDDVWDEIPREAQQQIIDKHLKVHVIDASKVASGLGLGSRVNTILQTCFFALSGVMPQEKAIEAIKAATDARMPGRARRSSRRTSRRSTAPWRTCTRSACRRRRPGSAFG